MGGSRLMIGISGVRGVVGENLTPQLLINLGQAFGTYVEGGRVVVGRDTRPSGDMVKHAVFAGLLAAGCEIIDVGVCGTPSAALMIPRKNASGGIVISASHNPSEWNALKFFREDGVYLNEQQGRQLLDIFYGGDLSSVRYDAIKPVIVDNGAMANHLEKALAIVDVPALRKRAFRVALDCCNGAGSDLALAFLREVGAEARTIYCAMDGRFPHPPEPLRENLSDLCALVKHVGADVGFAQDADADRVALVAENGDYVGEEYSLCLAARHVLSHERGGKVVTNLSTTRMIEDVAKRYDADVVRTAVGEVNVTETMLRLGAVIGGEGNGGVIYPRVHRGRDALAGMAITLQMMLETGMTISALAAEIPPYRMSKQKAHCGKAKALPLLDAMEKVGADARAIDRQDGIKFDYPEGWVHVRSSNTEPIVRVYAEARGQATADALAGRFLKAAEAFLARDGAGK